MGIWTHNHACPTPRLALSAVKVITSKSFRQNSNVTTLEMSQAASYILGVPASSEADRRRRFILRQ